MVVVVVVRFSSITGLSVVVVVFRITSPVLSCLGVDEQAIMVAISMRRMKQGIKTFLFFIAINPLCKLVAKKMDGDVLFYAD
jgi:hypothetical protein